jgi:superfamily II DNA helicase RecQ
VKDRIVQILREYGRKHKAKPRAICFCLTPALCDEYNRYFNEQGIKSDIFIGEDKDYINSGVSDDNKRERKVVQSQEERRSVLESFKKKYIQLICATSALGRGVHLDGDVRFAFFPIVPTSLNNYVQQSGRVGRDGKTASVYLFYREEDLRHPRGVLQYNRQAGYQSAAGCNSDSVDKDPLLDVRHVSVISCSTIAMMICLTLNFYIHLLALHLLSVCHGWIYLSIQTIGTEDLDLLQA